MRKPCLNFIVIDIVLNAIVSRPFKQWHDQWQYRRTQNNRPIEDAIDLMKQNNPVIIPQNHQVSKALKAADHGDRQPLAQLSKAIEYPYQDNDSMKHYQQPPLPMNVSHKLFVEPNDAF